MNFKIIGEKDTSHNKKVNVKILLSEGNKVLTIEKELGHGTSDEIRNDKIKERWNVPLLVSDALDALEQKVKEEKRKNR